MENNASGSRRGLYTSRCLCYTTVNISVSKYDIDIVNRCSLSNKLNKVTSRGRHHVRLVEKFDTLQKAQNCKRSNGR